MTPASPDDAASLTLRRATAADAATIAEQRVRMFLDIGTLQEDGAEVLRARLPDQLAPMLASGEYLGWFFVPPDDVPVAGAGVQMRTLLSRPGTFDTREALVVNVYVAPEYRRHGLARRLMEAILAWATDEGIERVVLHASWMGRPLYESLGFVPTNEMILNPKQTSKG